MIYYKTDNYNDDIVPVDVNRATAKTIWIKGRHTGILKTGVFYNYFETHEQAVNHKRNQHKDLVNVCRQQLEQAEKALAEFNNKYPQP